MRIAVLTSPNQWYEIYAEALANELGGVRVFHHHTDIKAGYDVLFILSYHHIIEDKYLNKCRYNIVVHASDLPQGKGWSPLFWQVLEGKSQITFSMFEAGSSVDDGDIYLKRTLLLNGSELNEELRHKQAQMINDMCLDFVGSIDQCLPPTKQIGDESFYPKRNKKHSELDVNKTIAEQFDLLRIVSNEEYPAFFYFRGHKYFLTIEMDTKE